MRILYFDIDGGRGGSGRSLYYLLKHLDRDQYIPHVIMGREGPNILRYDRLGVTHELQYLPRASSWYRKNWYTFPRMGIQIMPLVRLLSKVRRIKNKSGIDCIHFNHDSLFYIGWWLRRRIDVKCVYHIRTQVVPGNWGRWQVNMIDSLANHIIFISENELSHFQELNGRGLKAPHSVIYNSADAEDSEKPFMGFEGLDGRFKILSLGNISYIKGIDRLVDVAEALRRLEDTQSVFIVCGRDADPRLARGMRERAERTGLQDYFRFVGWQAHPEAYLRACDAVINLTREDNPWGRDIIEAMTHGKPVVSLGHYSKFIEHGQTGVLLSNYHPESVARELIRLGQDSQYRDELGRKAKARSKELFDGRAQARRVEEIYEALVKSPGT